MSVCVGRIEVVRPTLINSRLCFSGKVGWMSSWCVISLLRYARANVSISHVHFTVGWRTYFLLCSLVSLQPKSSHGFMRYTSGVIHERLIAFCMYAICGSESRWNNMLNFIPKIGITHDWLGANAIHSISALAEMRNVFIWIFISRRFLRASLRFSHNFRHDVFSMCELLCFPTLKCSNMRETDVFTFSWAKWRLSGLGFVQIELEHRTGTKKERSLNCPSEARVWN